MILEYEIAGEMFDVLAIHKAAGNIDMNYTTANARGVLSLMNEHDIPMCNGSNFLLVIDLPISADDIHNVNGMGGHVFKRDSYVPLATKTALESYVEILKHTEEKITIVAVGPLKNVAFLLRD